jgi:hypothetical protein
VPRARRSSGRELETRALLCAAAARIRSGGAQSLDRPRGRGGPGPGGRAGRRPRGLLALLRDRARHGTAVRGGAAGGCSRDGRGAGQGGARRGAYASARRGRGQRGGRRGRCARPAAALPLLNLRYAWPSGDWGSLPIEGGLEAAYRRELEAAEDPEALRAEIAARLDAVRSPFRTAERFSVEEIIDPRDTRPLLCDWAERAHELIRHELHVGPKACGPRP